MGKASRKKKRDKPEVFVQPGGFIPTRRPRGVLAIAKTRDPVLISNVLKWLEDPGCEVDQPFCWICGRDLIVGVKFVRYIGTHNQWKVAVCHKHSLNGPSTDLRPGEMPPLPPRSPSAAISHPR